MGFQIVIVEDDPILARFLKNIIQRYHRPFMASNLIEAENLIENVQPDLVFTDLNLSNDIPYEGLHIIEKCTKLDIPSIVLTGHEDKDIIKSAFEKGCLHYLIKEEFEEEVEKIIKYTLGNPIQKYISEHIKTKNQKFRSLLQLLFEQSENQEQTLLLTGETGVGKTFLAKHIHHYHDPKGETPFIAKNLAELSENLIESELFGHKKGAFTGAIENRKGWIEKANGGTLFLDEIGALPLSTQQKLLKVIEEKILTPLGSTDPLKVNFRLISATCEDIEKKLKSGQFRVDFYFRIRGHTIEIPPLRKRTEDIKFLIEEKLSLQKRKIFLEEGAMDQLLKHSWPGNIRELFSLLNSLYNGRNSFIHQEDLIPLLHFSQEDDQTPLLSTRIREEIIRNGLPQTFSKLENEIFKKTLEKIGQRPNKICEMLKISKSVFYRLQSQQS